MSDVVHARIIHLDALVSKLHSILKLEYNFAVRFSHSVMINSTEYKFEYAFGDDYIETKDYNHGCLAAIAALNHIIAQMSQIVDKMAVFQKFIYDNKLAILSKTFVDSVVETHSRQSNITVAIIVGSKKLKKSKSHGHKIQMVLELVLEAAQMATTHPEDFTQTPLVAADLDG